MPLLLEVEDEDTERNETGLDKCSSGGGASR